MKTPLLTLFTAIALIASCLNTSTADAFGPGGPGGASNFGFSFAPFGFYQPYGAFYGTSLRTPPHFAINPPVYYGARFARPYGMSPFAAPPMVQPPHGYHGRLDSLFERPLRVSEPICNPYVEVLPVPDSANASTLKGAVANRSGSVRVNPFASQEREDAKHLVRTETTESI